MLNLLDRKLAYILISPEKYYNSKLENDVNCERICSILYSKDYTILQVQGYYKNKYEKAFLAFTEDTNDNLRFDAIYLMDKFHQESVIVKYRDYDFVNKIMSDGSEKNLSLVLYDSEMKDRTYLYNGVSFTFLENKKYYFPKKKEELRKGLIVEYYNNNNWVKKEVVNIEIEWDKLYKLLTKYEKLRVETE